MCSEIIINKEIDKNYLKNYLTHGLLEEVDHIKSSYVAALLHARESTGRNGEGHVVYEEETGSWMGACMYMILLDHIGGLFRSKEKRINGNNSIRVALESFTDLSDAEVTILVQLRNAFMHRFNLYDIPRDTQYDMRLFSVNRDPKNLITFPRKKIDNNFDEIINNTQEYTTIISLRRLGQLVEDIHCKLLSLLENGNLILKIDKTEDLEFFLNLNTIQY